MTEVVRIEGTPFHFNTYNDKYPKTLKSFYDRGESRYYLDIKAGVPINSIPTESEILSISKQYIVKGNYGLKLGLLKLHAIRNAIIPELEKSIDISKIYVVVNVKNKEEQFPDKFWQWKKLTDCREWNYNANFNAHFFWTLTHD